MNKRKSHEEFEKEMNLINSNIKLISKYVIAKEKIDCECLICGNIWSARASHLKDGAGCPNCSRRKSHDDFLKELFDTNQNIVPLEKYCKALEPIKFKCKIDGNIWTSRPSSVLEGSGCPVCALEKRTLSRRKTQEQFLNEIESINGNIEILGEYINNKTKILCKCKIDDCEWYVAPSNLLMGQECPVCASKSRISKLTKTHEEFVSEVKSKNPSVQILDTYVNSITRLLCKCPLAHTWKALPGNILSGHKCPICAGNYPHTHDDFMLKFNSLNINDEYEVLSEYIKSQKKILFRHKKCNQEFEMTPNSLLRGCRCPHCLESKGEREIKNILDHTNTNYVKQKTFNGLVGVNNGLLSYDFYLPDNNLLIEYQGEFHDGNARLQTTSKLKKQQEHDKRKRQYANKNSIKLLEIWYQDFNNIKHILEREGIK